MTTPFEIIQDIVLFAGGDTLLGPPRELFALLLTCRALSHALSFEHCTSLYVAIFAQKFDVHAPARRLAFLPEDTKYELRRRFMAIQCIRQSRTDDPRVAEVFYIALFMLLEDDGRNGSQLAWAGLSNFVQIFLRKNVFDGAEKNHGWPLETEATSLAASLAWHMNSRCKRVSVSRDI